MTQLGQWGSMSLINHISGNAPPYIGSTAPGTWYPGQTWINDSTSPPVAYSYNGAAWVTGQSLYIALCVGNPATTGPSGGYSVNITDLVEDTTTGYARQAVTFSAATTAYPSQSSNTNNLTFGPYTEAQVAAVQWCALVTVSTGTAGLLKYWWDMSPSQQVQISQTIIIGSGTLTFNEQ